MGGGGEPDSCAWPELEFTSAARQAASEMPVRWMVTAAALDPEHHATHLRTSVVSCHPQKKKKPRSPPAPQGHTSSILHPLRGFCGRAAPWSVRPIGSVYCRSGRNGNNSKHTNGRETKPQATDIQWRADHRPGVGALSSRSACRYKRQRPELRRSQVFVC